jgi:hypothetical protein
MEGGGGEESGEGGKMGEAGARGAMGVQHNRQPLHIAKKPSSNRQSEIINTANHPSTGIAMVLGRWVFIF